MNEEDLGEDEWAFDDVDGKPIDAKLVREARKEEMAFMKRIPVFEEVELKECWEKTKKAPISTKSVDHDKARDVVPEVRSRRVARDFKEKGDKDREDLFASMPPLEAKKALFKLAARRMKKKGFGKERQMKMLFIDVRKAHLSGWSM